MPAPASVALGAPSAATGVDTSRLALSAATVEGVKATATVQLPPGASVSPSAAVRAGREVGRVGTAAADGERPTGGRAVVGHRERERATRIAPADVPEVVARRREHQVRERPGALERRAGRTVGRRCAAHLEPRAFERDPRGRERDSDRAAAADGQRLTRAGVAARREVGGVRPAESDRQRTARRGAVVETVNVKAPLASPWRTFPKFRFTGVSTRCATPPPPPPVSAAQNPATLPGLP